MNYRNLWLKRLLFVGLLLLSHTLVYGQQGHTVSGSVTDFSGTPLPGASVLEVGTSNGVSTDFDGNFTINVSSGNATLLVTYLGFTNKEVALGGQTQINIILSESSAALDEVVVVGYGTQKRSDVTGSMVNVKPEEMEPLPNTSVLQSLKGGVAGLTVGTPDRPGEEPSFRVRGVNSISANNRPLVVLDGIIYNGSLNNISNSDIASVDILKDASAAAVYGSRSANGVLIITTKKGATDKPTFNFSSSYGFSNAVNLVEPLSPEGYLQKVLDFREANGQEANPNNIADYLTITEANNLAEGKTVDWLDRLVKPAATQTYNMSVSGRSDRTNYFLSGSYFGQDGIVENDDYERYTVRANFKNDITDWFSLSLKTSLTQSDYSGAAVPLRYGLSPYGNWYEDGGDSGELEYFPMEDTYFRHPELNLGIDDYDKRMDLWGLVSAEVDIPFVEGLKYTMNYSNNYRLNKRNIFNDNTLDITGNGSASKEFNEFYTWTFDNIFNYNRLFGNKHEVAATFLISREYQNNTGTFASASNYFSQVLGYNSLELGAVPQVSSGFGEQNQNALMGRLNYEFDNRYALTGTVRRDGFSGFSDGNKYATFYSAAFSWTITNESFLENANWLDLLKLRLSYGENGNQAIGRYQTLARISANDRYVFGDGGGTSNGVTVSSMANNELGWETTNTYNVGLDFAMFTNRLSGSLDLYSSTTNDLLMQRNIPGTSGFTTIWTNIGEVANKGIELSLNGTVIQSEKFSWDLGFVFDQNRNEIVSLFGVDDDGDGVEDDDVANRWFIGEPLGVFYGYAIDGIHQLGEADIPSGYEPGDFRIVDHDGSGDLSPDDRHILGYSIPNYQFGVTSTLRYNNISLFARINSVQGGNGYYMGNNIIGHNPNQPFASWSERFSFPAMDYWTPDNPSNTAARINYQPSRGHPYLEDRSFVRLQDVILSYSFDRELLDKLNIDGLSFNISGKNLYTWTEWGGYDPENGTTINGSPMLRTITFGTNFKF